MREKRKSGAAIWQRLMPLDQFRAVLILLGFTFIPIITAFAEVVLHRYRIRPAASMLGFAFSAVFVAAEMSVRSIDSVLAMSIFCIKWCFAGVL